MYKNLLSLCLLLLTTITLRAQNPASLIGTNKAATLKTINGIFKDADQQYLHLATLIKKNQFPKAYFPKNDSLSTSDSGWWCSGFYPGTLFYLYEQTKNPAVLKTAEAKLEELKAEQFNKSTHDLGFMMYCSFGNAYRLNPNPAYKEILINSAKSLCSRFDPKVGLIKSWNSGNPNDYVVIIDNMMNLELLFWATKVTGDSSYYKIAVTHADNTIKNHFRPDYSTYHLVVYNAENGAVKQKKTAQGFSDASAWARGQAWGLYGYTLMYRETKNKKYLEQAQHISDFILNNPNLPKDKIAYWDFNAPNIPEAFRDASAAAIMASAWLELSGYVSKNAGTVYNNTAKQILSVLSGPEYLAKQGTNGGFLLKHSVGHLPAKSEIDVAISYGDYYYIEALSRLKQIVTK